MLNNILTTGRDLVSSLSLQTAAGLTGAASLGGLGLSSFKKMFKRKSVLKEGAIPTKTFEHLTIASDGIFCSCGYEHQYPEHVYLPLQFTGLITGIDSHIHQEGHLLCLHSNCIKGRGKVKQDDIVRRAILVPPETAIVRRRVPSAPILPEENVPLFTFSPNTSAPE